MNWIKNIYKMLPHLLVIVSLTIAFDAHPLSDIQSRTPQVELVSYQKSVDYHATYLDRQQQTSKSTSSLDPFDCYLDVSHKNLNSFQSIKIQHSIFLEYSSILRTIVLNDIILQKSHWI